MRSFRYIFTTIFLSIAFWSYSINVIPHPIEYDINPYIRFEFDENTAIVVKNKELYDVAETVVNTLRSSTGYNFSFKKRGGNAITLRLDKSIKNREGYYLNISPYSIDIYGGSPAGVYYGLQTLLQLLPSEIESNSIVKRRWSVPCAVIEDAPKFSYRGLHCDPCRHFLPIDSIKKQIVWMSKYKLNVLHLHLTDDQLWTIEIKKYPKLVEIGSVRQEADGSSHSGYYTQEELKDLVAFAAKYCVTIIPEIEMPGHAMALLAAYPELGCIGENYKVRNLWGVDENLLCVGNDTVFDFIQNILLEVAQIFPSEYIHIGGDECPTTVWHSCSKCQQVITDNNLNNETGLYVYFLNRVDSILKNIGKRMICWDESFENGISDDATIMIWRDEKSLSKISNTHRVLFTPWNYCYFDHYQSDNKWELPAQTDFTSLKEIYDWQVTPKTLSQTQLNNIWGIQANVWSECLFSNADREKMIYPRLLALAEKAWSVSDNDWNYFLKRVDSAYVRLMIGGIKPYVSKPYGPIAQYIEFDSVEIVSLFNELNWPIYYVIDHDKFSNSKVYEYNSPFEITNTCFLEAYAIAPNGKCSNPISVNYVKRNHYPRQYHDNYNGLYKSRFYGSIDDISLLDTMTSDYPLLVDSMYIEKSDTYENPWVDVYQGYIMVDATTRYVFSSNLEQVWIDGIKIIDNTKSVKRGLTKVAVMNLSAGLYPIKLIYNNCINYGFPALWRSPILYYKYYGEENYQIFPSNKFFR